MNIYDELENLKAQARSNPALAQALLDTRGEDSYAAMRRSTNGGGENSPLLQGEDDLYEMFLVELL